MAKAKSKSAPAKGQQSITSFFGGGSSKPKTKPPPPKDDSSDVAMDDDKDTGKDDNDDEYDDKAVVQDDEEEEEAEAEVKPVVKASGASKKGKKKAKDEDEDADEEDVDSDDDDEPSRGKGGKLRASALAPDASDLPPIHSIPAMFADLVSRIPEIKGVVEHVAGRKLRVATMCSGTESPLLALDLIRRSIIDQHGLNFEFEHVFSCEIEPFKQAYIERNFHPPLLFRDVCELGGDEAHTAYGAMAPVPGDVDILIAGTSCVDYSNLNNEKQDIDANGESGRTFRGMMDWVKRHRPPIVLLENVCSAPWPKVQTYFEKNGYSATFSRVDTKHYYIPHTRTRVYLVAIDKKNSSIPKNWKDLVVSKLQRHASSSLDAFLLPSDDPRIHEARQKLVQESFNGVDRRTGRTDWGRCESRHHRARDEEKLGNKRPLTTWDEGGSCKLPDFAWSDWAVGQVERVWDLLDISLLRSAKKGVDPSYKTQVWNLSQNVDRTIGSNRVGICPCLTPSMIPYITNRGGPMVGLEALSMQGLPVDELLLTRETEDQLADLAGNAMSTTVVGSCILAALVVGRNLLKGGNDEVTYEIKRQNIINGKPSSDEEEAMDVDKPETEPLVDASTPIADRIVGDDTLVFKPLDLSISNARSLSDLLVDAEKSARLCECEGRLDMTDRTLLRCSDCGASSCIKCGGRPEHNLQPIDVLASPRLSPGEFAKELKSKLPMCISLSTITQELLDDLKSSAGVPVIPEKRWASWSEAVIRATNFELRFVEPKRQDIWTAAYDSPTAYLELLLHPQQPEWRLYAKPKTSEPANAEIRRILENPIGRLTCGTGLLDGRWQLALPVSTSLAITIKGAGEKVPSWESKLGLQDPEFIDSTVHSQLEISVPSDEVDELDRDISGTYTLLDKCGTANGALHRREAKEGEENLPPLFMLLDPHRTNDSEDCFVFSISKRRYEYGESRPIICKLDTSWRQSSEEDTQSVVCRLPCKWVSSQVELKASHDQEAQFSTPETLEVLAHNDSCKSATALLVCRVPLHGQAGPEWLPRGEWKEVDKVHERSTFKSLAWLVERIRDIQDNFNTWQVVDLPHDHSNCERCAPSAPEVKWVPVKAKYVAIENTIQAGEYERRLKRRPSPFITQLKLEGDDKGTVRIGINIPSLLHRALSRLPSANRTEEPILSWKLNTNFTPVAALQLPKFVIESNKHDKEHAQPPSFKIPLRKEQLRSLEWMLHQESTDAKPFVEEEISEAILSPLGWRAEGRAQRPVRIKGGVLADQVGYGKTAITLGLIDCASKDVKRQFAKMGRIDGKISTKATLIIVPPHLTRQWDSEVKKFTGKRFTVVVIGTASNLNSVTIEQIQDADIVVVASNLFKSNVYLDNLQTLAAAGELPTREGRHFNAYLQKTLASLRKQTDLLQDEGSAAVMKQMKEAAKKAEEEAIAAAAAAAVLSKRLKGKSYRDANDAKAESSKQAESFTQAESSKQAASSQQAEPKKSTAPVAQRSPSGPIMEVVIPVYRKRDSKSESSAAEETPDDEESDAPRIPKRRAAKKQPIVISDDEDGPPATSEFEDEDDEPPKSKTTSKASSSRTSRASTKNSGSSDYENDSAEETASDSAETGAQTAEASENSDDDMSDVKLKSKSKAKAKAKPKSKAKGKGKGKAVQTSDEENDDDMDVDEAPKGKGKKPTKRKATDDGERPAKKQKQKRQVTDPWKLGSKPVREDWTQMQCPPLEMFHFARKVVDEYTYLDGKAHSVITNLTAERQWVLSGTPPIHDFAALKTISAFLNLHLGVDDDGEGQSVEVKKRRREQTAVEKFHSFREVHSLEWHAQRHKLGQTFLDRFVRQNIAEIDEIPWTEKINKIHLPAAEHAIYLELEHHLRALDMTIKRGKKNESDREKRLAQSLGESKTAEEALLKRCSHFDLETSNDNAMKACDVIVREREKQLEECKVELRNCIVARVKKESELRKLGAPESMFNEYIRTSRTVGHGDNEASKMVNEILDKANVAPAKVYAKRKDDDKIPNSTKILMHDHKEATHIIRRLTKELVGRIRSLRYFTVVRDLQRQGKTMAMVTCHSCKREDISLEELAVLSSCGHQGCFTCVRSCAEKEECIYAASGDCLCAARVLNVVRANTLGVDDAISDGRKHFGMKLEKVVQLLKKDVPKDERVLIFVQFPDLMKKVTEALTANKIKFLEIKGTAHQKSKNLEKFQTDSAERVLLLNVMDESASGANLTSANHAIFLSPLLATSKEIYKACETQAVGRLVRYGQLKHVYVWRFLTANTIDEDIYEQRLKEEALQRPV